MKVLLLIFSLFYFFVASSQQCKIKFLVKDEESKAPLSQAKIEENGKNIGATDESGVFITKNRESGLYTFTIKREGYEVWEDYSINGVPDTTSTDPPVYLTKLSSLRTQFFGELSKDKVDAAKVDELYKRIIRSLEVLNAKSEKKDFLDEFTRYQKANKLEIKTLDGQLKEIRRTGSIVASS